MRTLYKLLLGAVTLFLFATALPVFAQNAPATNQTAKAQSASNQYKYAVAPPTIPQRLKERGNSLVARFHRVIQGKDGPWMFCDKDGYRCTPNPAYYGNYAYNYQPYPYSYYADGQADYSWPDVPLMGGFQDGNSNIAGVTAPSVP